MKDGMGMEKLNDLAVKAKTSNDTFNQLLDVLEPNIRSFTIKYVNQWHLEHDEVEQWVLTEVWNAVMAWDPNGMPFTSSWKWLVSRHVKSRIRALKYYKKQQFIRNAVRFDFNEITDETDDYIQGCAAVGKIPGSPSVEEIVIRQETYKRLLVELERCMSTMTELEKVCTSLCYIQMKSYADAQKVLNLHSRKPVDNALGRVKTKIAQNEQLRRVFYELQSL